jgi:hypothetical protein
MAKMKEEGLRRIEVQVGNRGGGSAVSLMSPVDRGRRVNLRPSQKAASAMKERNVGVVRATWLVNGKGKVEWLEIVPAKPGEAGHKVRDDGHIYVPTSDVGKAAFTPGSLSNCPEELIDGDVFRFKPPDGLRFDKDASTLD